MVFVQFPKHRGGGREGGTACSTRGLSSGRRGALAPAPGAPPPPPSALTLVSAGGFLALPTAVEQQVFVCFFVCLFSWMCSHRGTDCIAHGLALGSSGPRWGQMKLSLIYHGEASGFFSRGLPLQFPTPTPLTPPEPCHQTNTLGNS